MPLMLRPISVLRPTARGGHNVPLTTHNKPATAATIMRNPPTQPNPKSRDATTQQHTTNRQWPQRLCGISIAGKVARQHTTNRQRPQRLCGIRNPPTQPNPKSRDNTTTHNKPATAATIMRNFHHTAGKVARQHNNTQQTGNGRNDYAEFPSLLAKVARQHNNTQQTGNGRNDYVAKSRDNTTTHNKPAAAATIMRNFRTVSTQKSQRDKTA